MGAEDGARVQRLFDIVLALVLAVPMLPVMAVIALAVRLVDGGPVLYGAERMHSPERAFTLWKFRTMRADRSDSGVSGGDKSARITRTGRWLRRTRLDELPQLWNILRGDMGFVGPRPPLRQYVERFPDVYIEVLKSRPGVTGLATLEFHRTEARLLAGTRSRAETDAVYVRRCIPRKARLDLIYQRNRTLCYDLKLIGRTAAEIFGRRLRRR